MSKVEEILLHVTVIVVALFANKFVTYEFSVPKYAILTTFALLISAMLIYRIYKQKELKLYISMANISWFLFSFASLLSTISVYVHNRFYFRYSIDIAIYVVLTAFIGLYISNRFRTKESITRLLLTFIGTGLIVAIDALLNFYTGKSMFLGTVGDPYSRAAIKSTIGNTIFVANYMTMLLIPSVYFILSFDFGWKKYSYKNTLMVKIFSLVSIFLLLTTIIISQTRSEYISMIFSTFIFVVFYFIYARRTQSNIENKDVEKDIPKLKKTNKTLLVILLIGIVSIFIVYNTDNPLTGGGQVSVKSRFSAMASVSSRDERFLAWLGSIYQWKDSKIIGTGIGTYQVMAIDELQEVMKDHPNLLYGWNNFKRTHNDYFQILGETGIIGLAVVVLLICVLIIYAFKYLKTAQDKDELLLFLSLACAFIAFMVQSFFSFPGHLLPNSLLALFLAATATGVYFNQRKILAREIHLKGFGLSLFVIFLLITVVSSTYLKWNYFISEVYFKNGNNYYNSLIGISNDKSTFQQYEKVYLQKLEELNDLTGDFAYLKPENYKQSNLSGVDLEKQRINQISAIRAELQKNLANVQSNLKKAEELEKTYTQKARENLVRALELNHAYGKAHFYLASLCLRPIRISEVATALSKKDYSVLKQEYDDYQKCIVDEYK
ncbi:MAG TPA: O-antigen ligase family protein, partial [Pseudothermotoga sp.]